MTRSETISRLQCQTALNDKSWDRQKGQGGGGMMVMRWSDGWRRAKRRSASVSYWWKVKGSPGAHADSERQVITWKRASLLTEKGFRAHLCHSWQKQRAFSICSPRRKVSQTPEVGLDVLNVCLSWHGGMINCFFPWKCTPAPELCGKGGRSDGFRSRSISTIRPQSSFQVNLRACGI